MRIACVFSFLCLACNGSTSDTSGEGTSSSTTTTGGASDATDSVSETGVPTGGGSDTSTSGGMLPTCETTPEPGKFWGPCVVTSPNIDPTCSEGFCTATSVGNFCTPVCDVNGCVPFKCTGGTCRVDGSCVWPCAEASDCLLPNMICDVAADPAICVYPK